MKLEIDVSENELEALNASAYALRMTAPDFARKVLAPYMGEIVRPDGEEFGNGGTRPATPGENMAAQEGAE